MSLALHWQSSSNSDKLFLAHAASTSACPPHLLVKPLLPAVQSHKFCLGQDVSLHRLEQLLLASPSSEVEHRIQGIQFEEVAIGTGAVKHRSRRERHPIAEMLLHTDDSRHD